MKVTLVGAGPGDKGLLTIKGYECIQGADVVLYDRHVSYEVLALIPPTAELIDVGKNAGNHPVSQDEINRLLLEKATQGKNVIRLKGGDPFVFGRGGEEVEFLADQNIPFEVVPGVTSAVAGAAYAGIPVTHRDYVSSLHIITGHGKKNEQTDTDYNALVRTGGTLVFMMSLAAVSDICRRCIEAGMDENMPAAIIEKATTNEQRKFLGTVGTLPTIVSENFVKSPAVIIVGKVCLLSERLDWLSRKPLYGKRIIVARVTPGPSKLSSKLLELGCHVIEQQCANVAPLTGPGSALEKTLKNIRNYTWLVFTSSVGVGLFFDHMIKAGADIRRLSHLKIACVGPETGKALQKWGINADYYPDEYNGVALAHGLIMLSGNNEKLLIVRDKDGAEDLTRRLSGVGIPFDDTAIYEKTPVIGKPVDTDVDLVAFTSSSGVEGFVKAAAQADFRHMKAICIGEMTAAIAKKHGMEVRVSPQSTIDSMIELIKEICGEWK